MDSIYEITSYHQAKVISNKLRMRIISLFDDGCMRTSKQLSVELDMPASKVHYHVRELTKAGLLKLVETREKGGVIEKYYLPIAKGFRIALKDVPVPGAGEKSARYQVIETFCNGHHEEFMDAVKRAEQKQIDSNQRLEEILMRSLAMNISEEQQGLFYEELNQLLMKWGELGQPHTAGMKHVRCMVTAFMK